MLNTFAVVSEDHIGCTIAKAVSYRLLLTEVPVRSQTNACGICDEGIDTGTDRL